MRRQTLIGMALVVLVAGCSRIAESRFNPFNWFGQDEEISVVAPTVIEDPRPLVAQVTSVSIEQTPGGAILRAVGLPPRQGYWSPALIENSRGDGVVSYQFRLAQPLEPTRVSTQQSREVVVGIFLSDLALAGVREIRVLGAQSSRAVRR